MDGIGMALLELEVAAVQAVPILKNEVLEIGLLTNNEKTAALPSPGHIPTPPKSPCW